MIEWPVMDDPKKKPGPAPDHVKLDDENWEEAISKAVKKPKPAEGWPKHDGDDEAEQPSKPQDDG